MQAVRLAHQVDRHRRQMQRLAQGIGQRCPFFHRLKLRGDIRLRHFGAQIEPKHGEAGPFDLVAQRPAQGVYPAAFEAGPDNHRLAANRLTAERQGEAFQRLAGKRLEPFAPGAHEAAIGRLERRHRHAFRPQDVGPGAGRPQLRPACPPQRQQRRIGGYRHAFAIGKERQFADLVPAAPFVTKKKAHALALEPLQQRAQQRRGFHRLGEHPPRGADEGFGPQFVGPGTQGGRREGFEMGAQPRGGLEVAGKKRCEVFGMGDIEAAAPGHQKFAPRRRHALVHGDIHPGRA